MKVVDDYIALRLLDIQWESELLDERLLLPHSRHWRLPSALSAPSPPTGSSVDACSRSVKMRSTSSGVLTLMYFTFLICVITCCFAADLLRTAGASSLMFAETLAACVTHESDFHCGAPRNAIGQLADRAALIGVDIKIEP